MPIAIALTFGLLALRDVTANMPVGPDATRHLMNGALLYDLVRKGELFAPVDFAQHYYSRLPALSLPYHPPLFPAVEALSFVGFGVQAVTPRVLVALATAASAYLLFRLVVRTHGSLALATSSTIGFLALSLSLWVSRDVMLEFPMLFFVLGAMHCVLDLDRATPLRRGLAFGLLAGAAVWTKQHAVFLGLVPFVYAGLTRQWAILRSRALWIGLAVFLASVVGLLLLWAPLGGLVPPQLIRAHAVGSTVRLMLVSYAQQSWAHMGVLAIIGAAIGLLGVCWRPCPGDALYVAWAATASVPLLIAEHGSDRYTFVLFPSLMVLAWAAVLRVGRHVAPPRWAAVVVVAAGVSWALAQTDPPGPFVVRGPAEAAGHVVAGGARRVLYCGPMTNGHFVFAIRRLDPDLRTVVIRGDKLPAQLFYSQARLERFAHRYGIDYVVLEQSVNRKPWDDMELAAPWLLEREIAMAVESTHGTLRVFRFTSPSPDPVNTLVVPTLKLGAMQPEFTLRF